MACLIPLLYFLHVLTVIILLIFLLILFPFRKLFGSSNMLFEVSFCEVNHQYVTNKILWIILFVIIIITNFI